MAELINQTAKRRTRSNRSSSSSTENISPLTKRAKGSEEEVDDEVMTALILINMAGEFKETLEAILAKVSKIDVVNDTVERIETSFINLEKRLSSVEELNPGKCFKRHRRP